MVLGLWKSFTQPMASRQRVRRSARALRHENAPTPRGEKHSADVIGPPVMGIKTREIEDVTDKTPNRAKGGKVRKNRAEKLSKAERSIIARDAAIRRWSKRD